MGARKSNRKREKRDLLVSKSRNKMKQCRLSGRGHAPVSDLGHKWAKLVGKLGNIWRVLYGKAKCTAFRTPRERDEHVEKVDAAELKSLRQKEDSLEECLVKVEAAEWMGLRQKEDSLKECFVPLTLEDEREIICAFKKSNWSKILVSHERSSIDLTGEKLQCLRPRRWLNDEVINVYFGLLKDRETREPQKFLKCHFFNTFFYEAISRGGGYDYENVQKWTDQEKLRYYLLECDKIFVPIHQKVHWCLAIINKKEEKFQYLDSRKGVDSQVLDTLARYYVDEVKDKTGKGIDVSSWEREFVMDIPEQKNCFDCGMFMIKYADFHSRDIGLCFGQEHMPYFRKRTAMDILSLSTGSR